MIIIDFSQMAINAITVELKGNDLSPENPETMSSIRHIFFNSFLNFKRKYYSQYGPEIVFAVDCKDVPYWRKELFPHYKANRKKEKENSLYDWKFINQAIDVLKAELKEVFPYKVIEAPGAEADDVVAVISEWVSKNRLVTCGVVEDFEPILLASSDSDYSQLMVFPNVRQHSFKTRALLPQYSLRELYEQMVTKIVCGERGDGIPNILSPEDSFVTGTRQKQILKEKFLNPLIKSSKFKQDLSEEAYKRFDLNKRLIDFNYIPDDVRALILGTYDLYVPNKKDSSKLMKYLSTNRLNQILRRADEF